MRPILLIVLLLGQAGATGVSRPASPPASVVLKPARVFDGEVMHEGWAVRVKGDRIEAAGPASEMAAAGATVTDLPGTTLLPGLVEGHSHVLLHPYNETPWNDQVLKESLGLRTARAVNHLRATLFAGFTTIRDLGTEGAGYADAELKQAVNEGIVPGPRMLVSTRAIVATGSYGPKGYSLEWRVPQGAEEADGDALIRVVRDQIGHGADWIKVYADYSLGAAWRDNADVLAGRAQADCRHGPEQRAASRRPREHTGRDASGRARGRRDDRAWRRWNAGSLQADGGAQRGALSDARRRRRDLTVCRLEEGQTPEPASITAQARELQGGARRGRHDPERQRRGRVHPWRQRARARADGRLRHDAGGRSSRAPRQSLLVYCIRSRASARCSRDCSQI